MDILSNLVWCWAFLFCDNEFDAVVTLAMQNGNLELLKQLLEVDETIPEEGLCAACGNGHLHILQFLQRHYLEIFRDAAASEECLLCAAENGHGEIFSLLLLERMSIDDDTRFSDSAFCIACKRGFLRIMDEILDHRTCFSLEYPFMKYASLATEHGQILILRRFFEIHNHFQISFTAIAKAACNGFWETCQFLIGHGFDVNQQNGKVLVLTIKHGFQVSAEGNIDAVQFWLGHGANVSSSTTALLTACEHFHSKNVVTLLLNHGANVNGENGKCLVAAVRAGNAEVVRLLLEVGASVHLQEETLWDSVTDCNRLVPSYTQLPTIVELLIDHGANANYEGVLAKAMQRGEVAIAELLLERGAQVTASNVDCLFDAWLNSYRNNSCNTDQGFETLCRHGSVWFDETKQRALLDRAQQQHKPSAACCIARYLRAAEEKRE